MPGLATLEGAHLHAHYIPSHPIPVHFTTYHPILPPTAIRWNHRAVRNSDSRYVFLSLCLCLSISLYLYAYVYKYTSGLEGLHKDEKMSVRVWGNPAPFAVGTSLISWEIIEMGGVHSIHSNLLCPALICFTLTFPHVLFLSCPTLLCSALSHPICPEI
jgi:hypothetical protein